MAVFDTERLVVREWTTEPADLAGWHLHPDSWGHGCATEAARLAAAPGEDRGE